MSTAEFEMKYDGDALRNGAMNVADLAPALLAMGELLQAASRSLNGPEARASVSVHAEMRRGSFSVVLSLDVGMLEQVKNYLFGPEFHQAADVLKAVVGGGGAIGLVKLIKLLQGKKPDAVKTEGARSIVVLGDNNIIVDRGVALLYESEDVRREAARVLRPLERQGIDVFEVHEGQHIAARVAKDEVPYFAATAEPLELTSSTAQSFTREVALRVQRLSWNPSNKWKFTDGAAEFSAQIVDSDFWEALNRREFSFAPGDGLLVLLSIENGMDETGSPFSEYTVVRVLRHLPAPRQTSLL